MIYILYTTLFLLSSCFQNSDSKWRRIEEDKSSRAVSQRFFSNSRDATVRALSSHSSLRGGALYSNHTLITLTWRNVTGMDCDFQPGRKCNWTWDEDSYSERKSSSSSRPGQHGFYRCNGKDIGYFHKKLRSVFFGPGEDKKGSSEGYFLYLLGKPLSDAEEISDKRLLSALLAESGNQCTVEVSVLYQDIEGAHIIVGIENVDNAYTPYRSFIMGQHNDTTHGSWKTLTVKIGRNISPFRIFIEIRRHKASSSESFIAIDEIKLLRCAPEDSGPIDCSGEDDPPYTCPSGDGISCLNAPSTLCDLKPDCPRGEDEMEKSCFDMIPAARCDFETFCGWRDPYESSLVQNSKSARWSLKSGPTYLEGGIKGDLSGQKNGKYLYYHYKREANTGLPKSVTLKSPPFPPPPKYNYREKSKYFQSCRIRFSYHRQIKGMMPGPIDIFIQWIDDRSKDNGYRKQRTFKVATPSQADKNMGWIRWEAKLPTSPQLRYQIVLSGMGSIGGAEMELAIDNFSLSPQCFGLEVPKEALEGWRYNMTNLEFCKYYGRTDCPVPKKLPGFVFTTCGMKQGAFGPEKDDCDNFYKSSNTKVDVSGESQFGFTTGIQRWNPPRTGIYTIIAKGASGAPGRLNKRQSRADEIRVIIKLKVNQTLFIVVGQMGQAFCEFSGVLSGEGRCDENRWSKKRRRRRRSLPELSDNGTEGSSLDQIRDRILALSADDVIFHNHSNPNSEAKKSDPFQNIHNNSLSSKGGGGGGGATIIFKIVRVKEHLQAVPLVIAAGGGGSADLRSLIDSDAQGLLNPWADFRELQSLVPTRKTDAGSGAGWNDTFSPFIDYYKEAAAYEKGDVERTSHGFSLKNGWFGGLPCSSGEQFGGFGGGGAGCRGGGGGGGLIGGEGGSDNDENGKGGWSYINMEEVLMVIDAGSGISAGRYLSSKNRYWKGFKTWKHLGQGQAQIIPGLQDDPCNCTDSSATCVSLDQEKINVKCACTNGIFLSHIHPKCSTEIPLLWKIGIAGVSLIALAIFGLLSMILYSQFQRKHDKMLRRKILSGPDSQLNRLRNMNGNGGGIMLTEYNPNYEFGGGSCSLQDLKEVPRENLRLVKALGQGAFGEVYQGSYKKSSTDTAEVAVKTLPELSSTQAEMDFLMEALIMSKFNHPNIVYFIGVCFDKHPRYIVLELLAGGDLKTFLRESRPKPDRSSPLVMKDLLACATDVAKGCEYLEENHFIHRDIAARNCLLTTKGPSRVVKIADFGMARDIYRADYYRKGGKTMLPVKWMPPEAFLDGIFTSKTDIWSFGILLWEVMSLGYMPYPGRGNQEVMQLVTNGGRLEPPNYCPGPVYGLMCQCWHPIPEERPNFKTILERLGYCMQDPEVVMAPLPMFHRPLSLDSRDTSLSNSSGRHVDTSLESREGNGFSSFPTRSSTASTTLLNNNNNNKPSTPDSPTSPAGDYLVPLVSSKKKPHGRCYVNGKSSPSENEEVRETSFTIMNSSSASATPSPPSALDVGALRSQQMPTPKCKYSNSNAGSTDNGPYAVGRSSNGESNEISV